jgi:hypothetical protein
MRDPLPLGGLIRKLWIGEAALYRDHLLRLDADSRRNRFAGSVSDDFVRDYADLSFGIDAVIHGFFVDGMLRGAAELRPLGAPIAREAEAAFRPSAVAEPRRRFRAARAYTARRAQSRHQIPARRLADNKHAAARPQYGPSSPSTSRARWAKSPPPADAAR